MTNYYIRSINQDGTGEVVMPELVVGKAINNARTALQQTSKTENNG